MWKRVFCIVVLSGFAGAAVARSTGACQKVDDKFSSEEGGCLQFSKGLVWGESGENGLNYQEAMDLCRAKKSGYQDWRLPYAEELQAVAARRQARVYLNFKTLHYFWALSDKTDTEASIVELGGGESGRRDKSARTVRAVCVRVPEDIDSDGVPDSSDKCNETPAELARSREVWTEGDYKGCGKDDVFVSVAEIKSKREAHARQRRLKEQEFATIRCVKESHLFQSTEIGCQQKSNSLVWSVPGFRDFSYSEAERYCGQLRQGGVAGWRLPTFDELFGASGNDGIVSHVRGKVGGKSYWSSTQDVADVHTKGSWAGSDQTHVSMVSVKIPEGTKELNKYSVTIQFWYTSTRDFSDTNRSYRQPKNISIEMGNHSVICVNP